MNLQQIRCGLDECAHLHEVSEVHILESLRSLAGRVSRIKSLDKFLHVRPPTWRIKRRPACIHSKLTALRLTVPLSDTKQVILEMLFIADLLTSAKETKSNTTQSRNTKRAY